MNDQLLASFLETSKEFQPTTILKKIIPKYMSRLIDGLRPVTSKESGPGLQKVRPLPRKKVSYYIIL